MIARGINVVHPNEISKIPDASADVITLFHVLEHVHGLAHLGKEIRRILKQDGTCVIAVPNAEARDARIYDLQWPGYDLPRHLYHFTRTTLTQFASQSGLKIVSFGSMPFDSFYCCIKGEEYVKGYVLRGVFRAAMTILSSVFQPSSSTTILAVLKVDQSRPQISTPTHDS